MDGYPQRDTISECLPRWIPSYVCWIILKLYRSYTILILSYKCVYALSRLQKYLNIQCSIISIKPSIQWPECPFLKFIIIYCKSYFPNTSSQSCTKNSHWFSRNLLGKILRIYVVSGELFTPHILLTQSLILILLSTSTASFHLPVSWFSARLFLETINPAVLPIESLSHRMIAHHRTITSKNRGPTHPCDQLRYLKFRKNEEEENRKMDFVAGVE